MKPTLQERTANWKVMVELNAEQSRSILGNAINVGNVDNVRNAGKRA
jgi:hypothetical protein